MPEHDDWKGSTDGTPWMHHALIRLVRHIDLRWVYAFMAVFVVPFYLLFSHRGYMAIYRYFRRRHGYGVWRSFACTWLNHYRFGQIILDRFAAYAGQQFHFDLDGYDEFRHLLEGDGGVLILSCHVGNYELAGYTFQSAAKTFNVLVYPGEAAAVKENRSRLLTANNIKMISVADDLSHVIAISSALADGEVVSIPADRVFGSPRTIGTRLLGADVQLPYGPFAIAAQRGVPTLAIFVMKESAYGYHVYIRRLNADASDTTVSRREEAGRLAGSFADELERVLRQYPEQWFNYYDFWHEDKQ